MKRRAFLGTLGTAMLGGCIGVFGDRSDEGREPTADDSTTTSGGTTADGDTTTESDDRDWLLSLPEVAETDPAPVENVEVDVTVTTGPRPDHPARLEFAFTNTADRQREFQFGSLVPWDGLRGDYLDGEGELLLAPGNEVVPDERDEDRCWRATDAIALPMVMRTAEIDAGETVSREFAVLATHDSETCPAPGDYRFEDDNYLGESWGFTLRVGGVDYQSENTTAGSDGEQ